MVATYLVPVTSALIVFPLLVLLVMLPVAFASYRRRGRAGGWTTVVFYSFLFYLLAIALQTIVPLPADASYCAGHTYASSPQLRPFYFVEVIEQRARGHWSPGAILHNPVIWTTALNVVMLAPLGLFLRYLRGMRFLTTTLVGFGLSLFFELTQLTGLWFVYPCPYRLFSVDDLILNTAGVVLGWLIAGPLIRVLPALEPGHDHRRYAAKVTFTRRLFALITDLLGFAMLIGFGAGLLTLFGEDLRHGDVAVGILALLWFVVVPTVTGSTLGKRAMLLRVTRANGRRAGPFSLLIRYGVLLSPLWLTWLTVDLGLGSLAEHPERLLLLLAVAASVLFVLVPTPVAVWREHRPLHERWSRTVNAAIVRELPEVHSLSHRSVDEVV